jgi:hypothetical protein
MKPESLEELNKLRKDHFQKSENDETFLKRVNETLQKQELEDYQNIEPEYPFLFVFGLPRSGTTIMAQFLIQSFDLGYINNFMARFWLAPITGIKLSNIILGNKKLTELKSEYATTQNIYDLHEFGYFWRYWLKIHSTKDAIQIKHREKEIEWDKINQVLANIQKGFNKPMCMKNIFGAYHLPKFIEKIPSSFWVYIDRDPIDVGISILNARKKFYEDINLWWSTPPPEYEKIKNLNYIEQIALQVYYLKKFYKDQIDSIPKDRVIKINYENLCKKPEENALAIRKKVLEKYNYELKVNNIPKVLSYNKHEINTDERKKLVTALKNYNLV